LPIEITDNAAPLDVAAALTKDRKFLTIAIVNPANESSTLPIIVKNLKLRDKGKVWTISHDDPMAFNDPDKAPVVKIAEKKISGIIDSLEILPLSITLFRLELKNGMQEE